jgi:hypothetical protein
MPMATDPARHWIGRRQLLVGGAALAVAGLARAEDGAAPAEPAHLAAAWDDAAGRHHVGLLAVGPGAPAIVASIEVPTRAHGLACLGDGTVLAAARRPGDWLLRWAPGGATRARWVWAEADRRFNGHVLADPRGRAIYTTETDLDSGGGRLVRRDAATLAEEAVWPTQGLDPHDMEWLPDGRLLLANGGIPTLAETGRSKRALDRMDSSLLRIDPATGAVDGQWRLADPRLSIRHLARRGDGLVGVALQAEHDDPDARAAAPLFALFDAAAGRLETVPAVRSPSGYAGDVAALPAGWLLSCPREHRVQCLSARGEPGSPLPLAAACALVSDARAQGAWALGAGAVRRTAAHDPLPVLPPGSQFDNHAVLRPCAVAVATPA